MVSILMILYHMWRWTVNQSIKVLRLTVSSELMMVLSRYAQSFIEFLMRICSLWRQLEVHHKISHEILSLDIRDHRVYFVKIILGALNVISAVIIRSTMTTREKDTNLLYDQRTRCSFQS